MHASPDAAVVRDFLARVKRRAQIIAAMRGAAIGVAAAIVVSFALRLAFDAPHTVTALLAVAGLAVGGVLGRMRAPAAALLVEQRVPASRNIVLTSAELSATPGRVPPNVAARVHADAARTVRPLDPAALLPARNATLALTGALAGWLAVMAVPSVIPEPARLLERALGGEPAAPAIRGLDVTIVPPAYTGRAQERISDPARIEALAGSELRISVRADAANVAVETVGGRDTLARANGAFGGSVIADADGYLAIEASSADGRTTRRLIGIAVLPDNSPIVRITTPGEDLIVPDGARTVDVRLEATDDIGLRALTLTFTRVAGSGEQHEFSEGEVALEIVRDSARGWHGRGTLRLDTLRLEPGDMVVYRGLARDARTAAPAAESDAYIISVAAPGDIPAEGYSADEEERYALSQQMVLLKTERLIARAPTLPPDSLEQAALEIAAEQRAVRAEFVFMMGGELAEEIAPEESMQDLQEEEHAELDDEAIAGRLRNRGRAELLAAIRAMSRANSALLVVDLESARDAEQEAIDRLQSAFSRTRYILRALTQRERLDLSRRLTGDLTEAGRQRLPSNAPQTPPRIAALRSVLADVAALERAGGETAASAASAAALAVLRIDPASEDVRTIAAQLDSAAAALTAGDAVRAAPFLDRATLALADAVRSELARAPAAEPRLEASRLHGALTDALRGSMR